MDNSFEKKKKTQGIEKQGYQVNIMYGDKSLVECMENVIHRLLLKTLDPDLKNS